MAQKILELLDQLMAGREMTPDQLDDLLRDKIREGQIHDYKHGNVLQNRKTARAMIREYLSAFANGTGGILIVGVDENTWSVTGCTTPGGGDLTEWVSKCLTPIAPYLSPPPRLYTVLHPDGNVLVVATERAPNLVPCTKDGRLVYYLRIGDQTLEAPEYLVSDILLGKRQHPYLHITDFRLKHFDRRFEPQPSGAMDLRFCPEFRGENQSLFWAENARVGVISWSKYATGHSHFLSSNLLSYVEVHNFDKQKYSGRCHLFHTTMKVGDTTIGPFDVWEALELPCHITPLRTYNHWHSPYTWKAAIYILSKGSPPIWYQLTFRVDMDSIVKLIETGEPLTCENELLTLQLLSNERPIVTWEGFNGDVKQSDSTDWR